jgi:hypothetical protein
VLQILLVMHPRTDGSFMAAIALHEDDYVSTYADFNFIEKWKVHTVPYDGGSIYEKINSTVYAASAVHPDWFDHKKLVVPGTYDLQLRTDNLSFYINANFKSKNSPSNDEPQSWS